MRVRILGRYFWRFNAGLSHLKWASLGAIICQENQQVVPKSRLANVARRYPVDALYSHELHCRFVGLE